MSDQKRKILVIIAIAFSALLLITALLFYYQKQGMIKIFPTKQERDLAKALEIDVKKFRPAEGLEQEKFEAVIEMLREQKDILKKDPKNSSAWNEFGRLKSFLNDHQGAVDAWLFAYELSSDNFQIALNLATTYQYFIRDFNEAEFYYARVLELQPSLTSAFDGLMDLYRYNLKEKQDEYEPLVLTAIQQDSANASGYYSNLVEFFMSKDTYSEEKAVLYWQEVNKLNSESASALLGYYPTLAELLHQIHQVEGIERIRFLTSHPNWMSDDLLDSMQALPKVMPHFELPIQAGDDEVLRRMHRGYTSEKYLAIVEKIRARFPVSSIATDLIVGFPGETATQFQHSLDLLELAKPDMTHVARYSPRPGTYSTLHMQDDVSDAEKWERFRAVEHLQEQITTNINAQYLNNEVSVLFEGRKKERWYGRTPTNKLVFVESPTPLIGKIKNVNITWTGPWSMIGEIAQ